MEQAIYKALQIIANKLTDMERKANRLKSEPSTRVSERNKRQQTSWQANKSSVTKSSKAWQTASTPSNVQQTSWLNYQVKSSISKQSRPSRTSEAKLASEQANQRSKRASVCLTMAFAQLSDQPAGQLTSHLREDDEDDPKSCFKIAQNRICCSLAFLQCSLSKLIKANQSKQNKQRTRSTASKANKQK